jgi:hypothetical protein
LTSVPWCIFYFALTHFYGYKRRPIHAFRKAIEARDFEALPALLADDVVLLTPVAFAPCIGRELVAGIVRTAGRVLGGFRYKREISGPDGRGHAVLVMARLRRLPVERRRDRALTMEPVSVKDLV